MPCANFAENHNQKISLADRTQEMSSLVAAEGDEMQVAAARDSSTILRHRWEEWPALCTLRKGQATQDGPCC